MNLPTLSTVAIACLVYVFINTLFTFVWLGIAQNDDPCNTGSTSFRDAFYFSLITLSTIGYGNQDLYFNGCVSPSIVIMLETLVGIFFDAAMLGYVVPLFMPRHYEKLWYQRSNTGTGKSQTIANVIFHYLAHGRRVLVTSKGVPATEVLRKKLPAGIRELCVALGGGDSNSYVVFERTCRCMA